VLSLIALVLTFDVSEWIADLGCLKSFSIYAGIMGDSSLSRPARSGIGAANEWPGLRERLDVDIMDG
jgi:hypothetical protein